MTMDAVPQFTSGDLYEAALDWHAHGFNVVPQNKHGEKYPGVYWTELQSRRTTLAELGYYNRRGMFAHGLGLITGAISGVIVIETDGLAGLTVLDEYELSHGKLPETLTIRSGSHRGFHFYFRHPGYDVTTRANTSIKLDVKGDRGFCVLPPSRHAKSGKRYEVVRDAPIAALPPALLPFIEAKAASTKVMASRRRMPSSVLADPFIASGKALNTGKIGLTRPPPNRRNTALVQSMLDALPVCYATDYDLWLRVGFALRDYDPGPVGLALWERFSKRCKRKADETDFDKRWSELARPYFGRRISLGWLCRHARDHGYSRPLSWDRSTNIRRSA